MSYDESYFHDADAPWMPKLVDVEYFKEQTDDADRQTYFSQFGWDALDHDASDDPEYVSQYPYINDRWNILTQRFNQRYYNRMIGAETMERWQNRLQNRFDEVAEKYERAYLFYDTYSTDMIGDVFTGEEEQIDGSNTASGSDSVEASSTNKNWDTPDTAINANASYADSVGTNGTESETTYGRKDTVENTRTKIIHGKTVMDNINDSIRDWKDIDSAFIGEFENLFLNVFWY